MTKKIIIIYTIFFLICSTIPNIKATQSPNVRLPHELVTMRATNGVDSYFDLSLSYVPSGFDITNGTYEGWCIQLSTFMARNVNHTVLLYSSYDPSIPSNFSNQNWTKVNYVINHKHGDRMSIQNVIWYYMCKNPNPMNDTDAETMITDANENGSAFIPVAGQKVAVIAEVVDGDFPNQRTFLELTLPSLAPVGGYVWNDYNANGIQDLGEPGIPNIIVGLFTPNGSQVDSVLTTTKGLYSFGIFTVGEYYIEFTLPSGYRFSPEHQGTNDTKDSDVNPQTGRTIESMFDPNKISNVSWDAGMYHVNSQGNPDSSPSPENHPPTADGTAGEPYRGIVGAEIVFNGSRSYDSDGSIITWQWSFGDDTTAHGVVVSHAYAAPGTFTVTLTVTDNDGANDTYHTTARIGTHNQAPIKPSFTGPKGGNLNISYAFNITTTDPNNENVQYVVIWGDGSQNTSLFVGSGQHVQMTHHWRLLGFYMIQVYAVNAENLSSQELDVQMAIDVQYVGSLGYLINTDDAGPFDMFYSNQTKNTISVQMTASGEYLITINGNEYLYNATTNSLQAKVTSESRSDAQYLMLIIGITIVVILVIILAIIVHRFRHKSQ
jgi:PKD repeat protein